MGCSRPNRVCRRRSAASASARRRASAAARTDAVRARGEGVGVGRREADPPPTPPPAELGWRAAEPIVAGGLLAAEAVVAEPPGFSAPSSSSPCALTARTRSRCRRFHPSSQQRHQCQLGREGSHRPMGCGGKTQIRRFRRVAGGTKCGAQWPLPKQFARPSPPLLLCAPPPPAAPTVFAAERTLCGEDRLRHCRCLGQRQMPFETTVGRPPFPLLPTLQRRRCRQREAAARAVALR